MSEELIQRNLVEAPEKMGDWNFYNIGATTLKALKNAKIIPNRDYAEFEGKKPDALIVKKPLVIAAIEYKTPQELRTKTQIAKAIVQELGTARALQARVYIITDGKKSFWVNPVTSCQGLFNTVHRIFKKLTQQKPGALWLPACSCGSYSCAIIWRTSSRSIRLILSSIVSVLVSLKCAHTR